jgi:hypothetical protein
MTKASVSPEAEQQFRLRRSKARSLLIALASDARTFNDQTLRARSLARIADTRSSVYSRDEAGFDVEGIFRELARQDYDRAVEVARGFAGEGPRAMATIAIARSVLEEKKPPKKTAVGIWEGGVPRN